VSAKRKRDLTGTKYLALRLGQKGQQHPWLPKGTFSYNGVEAAGVMMVFHTAEDAKKAYGEDIGILEVMVGEDASRRRE
jgi:hypothetical protein